jgi:hypothetical protein
MGKYTRAVSRQGLGKHVPAATNTSNNRSIVALEQWFVPKCYKEDQLRPRAGSSVLKSVKEGPEGGNLKNFHCQKQLPGNGL